ncbi:FlhC family transcriptional regulator [Thiococcus pfennigii]|uniref:FlhC family transcriptional regulator n=1 Tax=Thiococcus pfennigii TaxID=1057 RepID=UPI001908DC4B
MQVLDDITELNLAVELLRRKARVSIVHHETGVSRPKLRILYRELHGRGAPSGQLSAIGGATIQTRLQQVHAGLFAALYEHYAGPAISRQLDIRAVIAAHDFYVSLVLQEPLVDFNGAWVIARDLRVGMSELRSCDVCEVRYLISSESRLAPTCPFCVLHARRGGLGEPRLVLPAVLAQPLDDTDTAALSRG